MRFFCWVGLVVLVSCGPPDHTAQQQVLMDKRLQDKLDKFISYEIVKCKLNLLSEASIMADSILRVTNPILIQIDSIQRPPKPIKPDQPIFKRPLDSIVIAPIITTKILKDS